MKIIHDAREMRAWSLRQRCNGYTVGVVPTMGALHAGHASLIEASVEANDITILTLFVNPAQFAPHEDFDRYPRTWEADLALAERLGADCIYCPDRREMYPRNYATYVQVERLQDDLCGITRPHFFKGVATVVAKLFNATLPDRAYFGQKDAQQCAIIKRMVRDLDFAIDIVEMPIVRDDDGMALSSRNVYLTPEDRERGLSLSRGLNKAKAMLDAGERDAKRITGAVTHEMRHVEIDYISLVHAHELTPVDTVEGEILLAVAAKVGETRLIDNLKYEVSLSCTLPC